MRFRIKNAVGIVMTDQSFQVNFYKKQVQLTVFKTGAKHALYLRLANSPLSVTMLCKRHIVSAH